MEVLQNHFIRDWYEKISTEEQSAAISALENGRILFFPKLEFKLYDMEKKFLSPQYAKENAKNISFNGQNDKLRGATVTAADYNLLKNLLKRFSVHSRDLVNQLLPNYKNHLIPARTSYRPVQISNRKTSYRKDDKRLHVDAFPATPNQGKRLLRVFCNINQLGENRIWRVGESFETVAKQFLPKIRKPIPGSSKLLKILHLTKSLRTEYDHIMLNIHNEMKKNLTYQEQAKQTEIYFPSNTTWIVQTDQVSHAAMSGQYLLEQTFYLPVDAMLDQAQSPLRILERLMGRKLT